MSIYLTIPLLETLFTAGNPGAPSPVVAGGASLLPGWLLGLKEHLSQVFRDLVFRPDPTQSLLNICLVIVVAFLLKNLFGYLQSNLMTQIEQGLVTDLRNDLYRHIHQLPLAYFTNERTGNLISRIMKGHILYMSLRRIRKGEELTVDYHFSKNDETTPCHCRAKNCRRTINLS